jgi:hypothetical protein
MCSANEKQTLVNQITEFVVYLVFGEISLGIWKSIEYMLDLIVNSAYVMEIGDYQMEVLSTAICIAVSLCILLTSVMKSDFLQKISDKYEVMKSKRLMKNEETATYCLSNQQQSQACRTLNRQQEPVYRNPNCPCHGDHPCMNLHMIY